MNIKKFNSLRLQRAQLFTQNNNNSLNTKKCIKHLNLFYPIDFYQNNLIF